MPERAARQPGQQLHLNLPVTPWPEANRLLERYQRAWKQRAEAGGEVNRLDQQTDRFKAIDLENHAQALAEGKPKPESELAKHQAKRAEVAASLQPLELNRARAAEDFLDHIEDHKEEYQQVVADELAKLGNEPVNLSVLAEIERLVQWREWLNRFPRKSHVLLPVSLRVGVRGEQVALREVLQGVDEVLASVTQAEVEV